MIKLFYTPFAILATVLGGFVASAIFARVWKLLPGGDEAPDPEDGATTWAEVVGSAALHGAIFGVVKALTQRAGAAGFHQATGTWPGDATD